MCDGRQDQVIGPNAWEQICIARHPNRPHTLDYLRLIADDFVELHGDRCFCDDPAIVAGVALMGSRWITVVGHQKGRDVQERSFRNFGSARPGGYRKALRLMRLSEKFQRPIVCFIDTPGADCSVASEQHGISRAIAATMQEMFMLTVPIIAVIIGEGGSGGAIGIGIADRVLMLEHAVYSVISPEGCAMILWRDAGKGPVAAQALCLTAHDARRLNVVDDVVVEPSAGAHNNPEVTVAAVKQALEQHLEALEAQSREHRLQQRYLRFRYMGQFAEMLMT